MGDLVVVDGGMVSLEVKQKMGPDVKVEVVDPGIVLSRANLTFRRNGHLVRARNSMLPVLSSKVRLQTLTHLVLHTRSHAVLGFTSSPPSHFTLTRGPWQSWILPAAPGTHYPYIRSHAILGLTKRFA